MNFLSKLRTYVMAHWVTILALGGAVWAYAKPTVLNFVHNHPQYSFWTGLVGVVVSFYLKGGGAAMPPEGTDAHTNP